MNGTHGMRNFRSWLSLVLLSLTASILLNCASSTESTKMKKDVLRLSTKIDLPNVSGRIDHIAFDASTQRAFIAALGNNSGEVVSLNEKKVVHTITELREPQGILFVPSSNELVVTNGDDGKVIFLNATDFRILGIVDLKGDADNIRYDTVSNLIYVGYGNGAIAILDAALMKQTGNIALDGHPESFQLSKKENRIYVNVPDKEKIQVADLTTQKVIANWKNTVASSNFPMALNESGHILFVGCRSPAKLRVIDTKTGKDLTVVTCTGDADDVFYHASDSLIFVSGGSGFVDVFRSESRGKISLINHIASSDGARTSVWLADEKKLLVAAPARGDREAKLLVYDYVNY